MSAQFQKSGGNGHNKALHFHQAPRRVVSLVPSMTESLFDLGFGESVVGITDYCLHPEGEIAHLPRVGGPKNARLEDILRLTPDLVLANMEENSPHLVNELEANGVPVWVTFPKTVRQALDVLWALVGVFRSPEAAVRLETLERTYEWACTAAEGKSVFYFCPIWKGNLQDGTPWYMTFNQETYCHDLLASLGGVNIFAERKRRYPLSADLGLAREEEAAGRDTRYPRVTVEEISLGKPQIILLPSEPFAFGQDDLDILAAGLTAVPAVKEGKIHFVDGSLLTWHGTRLAHALQVLPALLDAQMGL